MDGTALLLAIAALGIVVALAVQLRTTRRQLIAVRAELEATKARTLALEQTVIQAGIAIPADYGGGEVIDITREVR